VGHRVRGSRHSDFVTVDPSAWNERALRWWAKAGFVEVSRHEADEEQSEEWVMMRFAALR
jgi:hypothetical protein